MVAGVVVVVVAVGAVVVVAVGAVAELKHRNYLLLSPAVWLQQRLHLLLTSSFKRPGVLLGYKSAKHQCLNNLQLTLLRDLSSKFHIQLICRSFSIAGLLKSKFELSNVPLMELSHISADLRWLIFRAVC